MIAHREHEGSCFARYQFAFPGIFQRHGQIGLGRQAHRGFQPIVALVKVLLHRHSLCSQHHLTLSVRQRADGGHQVSRRARGQRFQRAGPALAFLLTLPLRERHRLHRHRFREVQRHFHIRGRLRACVPHLEGPLPCRARHSRRRGFPKHLHVSAGDHR